MKRELKVIGGLKFSSGKQKVAKLIPMKRELKGVGPVKGLDSAPGR